MKRLTVLTVKGAGVARLFAVLLLAAWLSAACMESSTASGQLLIQDGYVRGLPPGQPNTAAFMRLVNTGDRAVQLVAASSDSAERAEFHQHIHRGDIMRMEKQDSITVPAGGEFVLAPGGHHMMLLKLRRALQEGDQVTISLTSAAGQQITAQLPVRSVLNEPDHSMHTPDKPQHEQSESPSAQHHHHH